MFLTSGQPTWLTLLCAKGMELTAAPLRQTAGEFQNGKKDGFGTYTYPNGDVYQGYWLNDKRAGEGKYFFKVRDSQ